MIARWLGAWREWAARERMALEILGDRAERRAAPPAAVRLRVVS